MARTAARAAGAHTNAPTGIDTDKRTPAQWYCLVFGGTLLLVGLLGFLANASFVTGKELEDDPLLGIFDVNGWHNVVHVASGAVLLAFAKKRATAKAVALTFGIVYGVVTLLGFIDGTDILAIIPTNAADNVLHLVISALAILSALVSSGDDKAIDRHAGADRVDDRAGNGQGHTGTGTVTREPLNGSATRERPAVPPTRT